jgi:hypothetical protein
MGSLWNMFIFLFFGWELSIKVLELCLCQLVFLVAMFCNSANSFKRKLGENIAF